VNRGKVKIKLSGVPQTSLLPLHGRAKISRERSSLFYDAKAVELVELIDYDCSMSDAVPDYLLFAAVARAKQFDDKVRAYITQHPRASVVNIGAGLDTAFYRVDNGTIHWYDLDLPAVIDLRRQLLLEPDRVEYIAKSFLDPSWCKEVNAQNGVFMIAAGLFHYFEEAQIRQFFSLLADSFPGGEIVFDVESKSDNATDGGGGGGWSDEALPEQREAMQAAVMESLKKKWKVSPQDQKDAMLRALTTPTKPHGAEWSDVEAWWNELSVKEKEMALHDFRTSIMRVEWGLEDASDLTK
jgi:O-methyltransferase involved in polyketide biosynthesis